MSVPVLPAARPAWREPFVWLVFGIPGLTIVAGLLTWWIAAQRADSNVAEDWYKRGVTINRSLERESRAAAQSMSARLQLVDAHDLRVVLRSDAALPASVSVMLVHPVRAEQDRRLTLDRQPDGSYRTVSPLVAAGNWGLAIEAQDWRISARRIVLVPGGALQVGADGRVD